MVKIPEFAELIRKLEEFNVKYEITNKDIGYDELQILIDRIIGIQHFGDISSYDFEQNNIRIHCFIHNHVKYSVILKTIDKKTEVTLRHLDIFLLGNKLRLYISQG